MNKTLLLAALLPLALHATPPRLNCHESRGECVIEPRIDIEPVKVTAKPIVILIEPAKPGPKKIIPIPPPPKPVVVVPKPMAFVALPTPKPVIFDPPPKLTPPPKPTPPPTIVYIAPKVVSITKAPELATGGIATALTLMIGGLLVIRGRKSTPSE